MRVLRGLIVLLLCTQLLAGLVHRHAANATAPDCAACVLAAHWSGGAPAADPPPIPVASAIGLFLAAFPVIVPRRAHGRHVLPLSQAPPAAV